MKELDFIKLVRNRFEYIMDHASNVPISYRGAYLEGAIDHELCILDTYISERKGELMNACEQTEPVTKEAAPDESPNHNYGFSELARKYQLREDDLRCQ